MNLGDFAGRMHKRAANLPREVNKVVRLTALAVDQTVVMATPVDTGRARSNWLVSLGRPRDDTVDPYAPIEEGGSGETANAQAAIAQGQEEIGRRLPEQAIYITNNVSYIGRLNEGHSAQAPAAFVEAAVAAGVAAVKNTSINTG